MKQELQSVACFEIFNRSRSNKCWEKFKETINGLVKVYQSTKVDSQKKQFFVDEKNKRYIKIKTNRAYHRHLKTYYQHDYELHAIVIMYAIMIMNCIIKL